MIRRVLVANRGEIARRVFATCRRLGVDTVAVFSDADAGLPFVREADQAVRLPGSAPSDTYLRTDLLLDAARRTGADAVHPGYGFLSENAGFARAVLDAGLTWIGPAPESIEAMGSKVAAKKLMRDAGVPVLEELDPSAVTDADLPLLVKASAGGGGRGMRVVRTLADVAEQVRLAADEAASAFGDPTVFCEPYVERGRHVEVQVLGDRHGHVAVLGERDCSLQRRHQKVLEECPAPALPGDTRARLHDAARRAAQAIGYVGVGTVEFLVGRAGEVFFLEMNTRLQVEHPVTEAVFGVDLVALQLAVAEGTSLQDRTELARGARGHAVEVRLYAEDPSAQWRPQSGVLTGFALEHDVAFGALPGYGVRLDAGVESGNEVGTFYDAMLAKVVAWGPDRGSAFRALAGALQRARIHGLTTNRDLLVRLLRDPAVLAGEVSTDLLESRVDLLAPAAPDDVEALGFAAAVMVAERDRAGRKVQRGVPVAWRNVVSQPQRTELRVGEEDLIVPWYGDRGGYRHASRADLVVVDARPDRVLLERDGVRIAVAGRLTGDEIDLDSPLGSARLRLLPRFVDPAAQVDAGSLLAPMPGTVVSVAVAPGDEVAQGETVLVLEAMKMQHTVSAPAAGVVAEIDVKPGDQVTAGAVLAVLATDDNQEET
jgi:propionyl-CoA carboxylase alpha chain